MSASINSIPASQIVSVVPSVVSGGGTGLDLIELMLTVNTRVPIGAVLSFPTSASVISYFGAGVFPSLIAPEYFNGYDGSTKKPGALLFAQYPLVAVGAWLRGGNVSGLTLAQLQALSGVLTVTVDGTPTTSSSINLSSTTSFTSAAQAITTALGLTGPSVAAGTAGIGATFTGATNGGGTILTVSAIAANTIISIGDAFTGTGVTGTPTIVNQLTGTPGGNGTYTCTTTAGGLSAVSMTTTSTVMNVSAFTVAGFGTGQQVTGSGVTADTFITARLTGTGGTGTYTITPAQHVVVEAVATDIPTCTYDPIAGAFQIISATTGAASTISFGSGTIAASLMLTQATGAVTSQGAGAAVPGPFMDAIIANTTNWATFETIFDPDGGSGNAQKLLFAAWANAQANRYGYLMVDGDPTPTESTAATGSAGYILKSTNSTGTVPIYNSNGLGSGDNQYHGAFIGGYVASLNFDATNGRATLAFRSQTGLTPSVTNATVAANLIANGYNFYGAYATANQGFEFAYPGSVTGPFSWLDSFANQIWFNNACQLALMEMLTQYGSIPYNPTGYGYIRAALADPINAALNFGAIRAGVPLSSAQASEVNALAGIKVDQVLATAGWYLVIQPATAQVRAARGSPTIILLYMDGESIQKINLSSVLVQ